jgi:hypothetical protein
VHVFVVERYLPALTADGVRAQARREKEVVGLRHVRTTYLRDDELCFSVFEAPSIDVVREANDRMGMAYERITEAIDVTDEAMEGRAWATEA